MKSKAEIFMVVAAAAAVLFVAAQLRAEGPVILTFMDAGEGDAIIIDGPAGSLGVIDTGNLMSGIELVKELKRRRATALDFVALTHPHLDHIGGVFAVLQFFKVGAVYDNGEPLAEAAKSDDALRWYKELARRHKGYRALSRGDEFSLGEVRFRVLWPPKPLATSDWNSNSLVLKLEYGKFKALLMGDANQEAERALLAKNGKNLAASVLKAGHHGAADTALEEFVAAVSPRSVVVSVDKDNLRGYPSGDALHRYLLHGAAVYRTDLSGSIRLEGFKDGTFNLNCQRPCESIVPLGRVGNRPGDL